MADFQIFNSSVLIHNKYSRFSSNFAIPLLQGISRHITKIFFAGGSLILVLDVSANIHQLLEAMPRVPLGLVHKNSTSLIFSQVLMSKLFSTVLILVWS